MWLVGARAELGQHYQVALGLAAAVVLVQFWIARGRGREACFLAFRANQWVGLLVFAGIAGHYALG
jgi:4-hydroxybenzoate polyprenyltransferase